ncbi:DUF4004 family protein [Clostridium paraputrificum]|uniref:DUF4004 family protein n=1 Tax=Clostridium TaxID=1485 RepID=UPI003D350FAE
MYEELISKKELLEVMEISYGQLYRWKRKKLIPEEWFIKKSVSTGQETFFPRNKIIERIEIILNLKEEASLDELAFKFSNSIKNIKLSRDYLINVGIVDLSIIEMFETLVKADSLYDEGKIFGLLLYNELINSAALSLEEVNSIVLSALKDYSDFENDNYTLIVKRKLGVPFYYVTLGDKEFIRDESAVEIIRMKFKDIISKINSLK